MSELIPVDAINRDSNNEPTTTSLVVADVFGKRHCDILRDIKNLDVPVDWGLRNFAESYYINGQNKQQPMIVMTRDGFDILVMGFTGSEAMKYKLAFLEAFNRMKNELQNNLPQNLPDALEAYAKSLRENERLEKEKQIAAPKVAFAESISVSNDTILVRELAKIINCGLGTRIGGNRLFKWLRENGYLINRKGCDYNLPTQKSIDLGIMVIKEGSRHNGVESHITKTTKVTGKGQIYFIGKFKELKGWK